MANGSSDNTTLVAGSWMSTESLLKLGVGLLLGGLRHMPRSAPGRRPATSRRFA